MTIKAFIFDFDGLILDTETPDFEAWQDVFQQHGHFLPLSEWQKSLGTSRKVFDPPTYLEELLGHPIDKKAVEHRHQVISLARICQQKTLPGVTELLVSARERGIKLAVASSSSSDWVWLNLARLDLAHYFDTICTGNEVHEVKPNPAVYLLALKELGVKPEEAVVFEDSPNGIRGAKNAGIFCVAVPNGVSSQLNVEHADLIIKSLADITINEILAMPAKS